MTDPIAALTELPRLSTEDLDRLIDDLARPERRPTPAHQLARAHALGVRFERDHSPATLAEALRIYTTCAYRGQRRGLVGRFLVVRQLQAALLGQPCDVDAVSTLIDDAGDDPVVPGTSEMLRVMTGLTAAYADDSGYDRASALQRLDELAGSLVPGHPFAWLVTSFRLAFDVKRGVDQGVLADSTAAVEHARELLERGDLTSRDRILAEAMLASSEALAAVQRGDMPRALELVASMSEAVDRLPPGDPAAESMRRLVAEVTGGTSARDADHPGLSDGTRAWRLMTSAVHVLQPAVERRDAVELARGVRLLREAVEVAPPDYPHRPLILTMLGRFLCTHHQLSGDRAALDEALRRLAAARQTADHPGHPVWPSLCMGLGFAHRLDGRPRQSRDAGQQALRGHAWSVLLQAGTADAADAARDAADDAREVARWCLADGDPTGAAMALDAGRCLMLYAATVTTSIPDRLRGLGHADLLDRWAGNPADADLRAEVLAAITGGPLSDAAVPELLDPPAPDEVGQALAGLNADALVYLVPADESGPGCAVLVPAAGTHRVPSYVSLPQLAAAGPVARHVDNLSSRDAGAVDSDAAGDADGGDWRADLDRLCNWAWPAAIGPLLSTLDGWRIGRAPRTVLVPMGDLGMVPWHAARDRDGTRAVELATFSYAASARLLCQNAGRTPVPAGARVLVVGDPTGDLPDARAEAMAVRAAFYPSARMLDGAEATPSTVSGWLLAGDGAVLHLACHGAVRRGIDGSHLRLSGGDRLSARDILQTRQRTAIGLVVLAACTTGVPSGTYDESFSLATAFLAAGARSVFGSLWTVPDGATSLLMFMAHHYLCAENKRPVDALNHAQRWMLDPNRRPPATMPADLAARVPLVDGDDVAAWAGFVHHGR